MKNLLAVQTFRRIYEYAKWTIGQIPCYVGTRSKCLRTNCAKCHYVAIRSDIPTIAPGALRDWADRHTHLPDSQVLPEFKKHCGLVQTQTSRTAKDGKDKSMENSSVEGPGCFRTGRFGTGTYLSLR